jgi:hypothetical protein
MGFSETVEALKNQYTDKYVKVDAARPELARFRDVVGQVKTVNMNGRALVEFLDYHLNIGWFDIDLSCLTVVDKPEPKAAAEKHAEPKAAAKPQAAKAAAPAAGEKKLSPLELARMQGAGKAAPAKPGGETSPAKKSTADILAAARGGAGAAPAAKPASGEVKPAGGKPSTADILAAARGGKPAAAAPASPTPAPPQTEAPKAPTPAPAPAAAAPASAGGIVRVDKSSMTVQQMIDYCRAKDSQ